MQRDRCWPPIGKFIPNHRQAFERVVELARDSVLLTVRNQLITNNQLQRMKHYFFNYHSRVHNWLTKALIPAQVA